jgi:transcriptional regulator with XRE-family HTH domain
MKTDRLLRVPDRNELSEFVRLCRERASPEELGLPATRRRRIKGLRREEVATLAGVGLTWYTWFEQGRDIQVSDDFLRRIARGLQLNRAEQEHLFALSGRNQSFEFPEAQLPQGLVTMIRSLPESAYILNKCWDVLAYNDAAYDLFEDFHASRPNMLRIVFFSDFYRRNVKDWPSAARLVLLKARHDFLTGGRSSALKSILDEIMRAFPEAENWWNDPEIVRIGDTKIELHHSKRGWTMYQLSILVYEDRPALRAVVFNTCPTV